VQRFAAAPACLAAAACGGDGDGDGGQERDGRAVVAGEDAPQVFELRVAAGDLIGRDKV